MTEFLFKKKISHCLGFHKTENSALRQKKYFQKGGANNNIWKSVIAVHENFCSENKKFEI